jgi:Uma2 family endonuclease
MATAALTYYTPEEYLALERHAEFRSEYIDGRIVALAGAPDPHVTISLTLHAELRARFRGRACRAWANEMRVQVEGGRRYTYPDVVAMCGEKRFIDGVMDTLTNPALIVEVLSPTTEASDRGEKFLHYRTIDTLREYVLVAQDRPLVERFTRHGEFWHLGTATDLDEEVEFTSVGCSIPLREIYENVEFPARTTAPEPEPDASGS